MLRWFYIRLLLAHPAEFRRRFGDEMLEAFDLSAGLREQMRLLLDGVLSISRQWVLRSEFHQPWQASRANGPAYELITFRQIEPYKPRRIALVQGGLVAILLLFGVVDAINHGGSKLRTLMIGMKRPGFGLIKLNRDAFEGKPLIAAEIAKDEDDPLRPFLRSYSRIVHVLAALDADGDFVISPAEMANAPAALRKLDLDHDGKLSAEECGFLPPGDFVGPASQLSGYRHDFMRENRVLAALDTNRDGVISADEIANSAVALESLDIDRNGSLSPYELLPNPATSQAAGMMGRFDANDSGVISLLGLPKEDRDIEGITQILISADRNHDGVVTRGELVVELATRSKAEWFREHPSSTPTEHP
jgi:Ca2+-binding EF-hand superfamily protein